MPYDCAKPCVLFSPLGMTDPIRGDRDGPFLHILRYYHPKAAVLFMTAEIAEAHENGNRYLAAAELVSPETVLSVCAHPEIETAHEFEIYDVIFSQELCALHRNYPDHQILVNISSGTPQMEASLYLQSAALPFEIIPVQVSSPNQKSNTPQKDFDLATAWSTLQETGDAAGNRCSALNLQNLQATILKKNIGELLKAYDYTAVGTLMNSARDLFAESTMELAAAAQERLAINKTEYQAKMKKAKENEKNYLELETADPQKVLCYEYILMLDTLLARKSYGDYARAISPALTNLMELVLRENYHMDVPGKLCRHDKRPDCLRVPILDTERIRQYDSALLEALNQSVSSSRAGNSAKFRNTPLAAHNLLTVMKYYDKKNPVSDADCLCDFETLRKFEEKIRNLAAHRITAITDTLIKVGTESSAEDAQAILKKRFEALCGTALRWDGYEKLNARICSLL